MFFAFDCKLHYLNKGGVTTQQLRIGLDHSFVLKYDNYKSTSKSLKCSAEKVGISAPVDIQGTGNQITLDPDYVVTCTDVVAPSTDAPSTPKTPQ